MKKIIYIRNLIYSIILTILLFYFYITVSNGKIFIIPFLVCSISVLIKNICILTQKEKYTNLLHQTYIFGIFSFFTIFLVYYYYLIIKQGTYLLIIPTIPFIFITTNLAKKLIRKDK